MWEDKEIILIRHGQSEANVCVGEGYSNRLSYNPNSHLTMLGKEQANKTGHFVSKLWGCYDGHSEIFCSPFNRTRKTAEIITSVINYTYMCLLIEPYIDIRLHEHIYPGANFTKDILPFNVDGYILDKLESNQDLLNRLNCFLDEILKDYEKIMIISHGTPIQTLANILKGNPVVEEWDHTYKNCSVTYFKFGELVVDRYVGHL